MLVKVQPAEDNNSKITYVVDRGIVSFAKFAIACLAIFILMGIYAFGIDVKSLIKDMQDAGDKIRNSEDSVRSTEDKLRTLDAETQKETAALSSDKIEEQKARSDLDKAVSATKSISDEFNKWVDQERRDVELSVKRVTLAALGSNSITEETLTEVKSTAVSTNETTNITANDKSLFATLHLWPNNTAITVGFIDGDPNVKAEVARIAPQWTEGTGIRFLFVEDSTGALIRVSFTEEGNWSMLGAQARLVAKTRPTMSLQTALEAFKSNDFRSFRKIVLLEFGHALGLLSEHQNPNAQLQFNIEKIKQLYNWNDGTIKQNFSSYKIKDYRQFDPNSVMMFALSNEFLLDGSHYEGGFDLSEGDKLFIRKLYPKAN
jgi:hypothetical protein